MQKSPNLDGIRLRRRLQYRLVSLFALMTLTCLGLSWYVWPKSVEGRGAGDGILVRRSRIGRSTVPQPRFRDYQAKLMDTFADPDVLQGRRGHRRKWQPRNAPRRLVTPSIGFAGDLKITAAPNSLISITLTVPERHRARRGRVRRLHHVPRRHPDREKHKRATSLRIAGGHRAAASAGAFAASNIAALEAAKLDHGPTSLEAAAHRNPTQFRARGLAAPPSKPSPTANDRRLHGPATVRPNRHGNGRTSQNAIFLAFCRSPPVLLASAGFAILRDPDVGGPTSRPAGPESAANVCIRDRRTPTGWMENSQWPARNSVKAGTNRITKQSPGSAAGSSSPAASP